MSTCLLTVNHWDGPLPLPGEFVMAPKGRTAFMVVRVDVARPGRKHVAKFSCERWPAASLPPDARVHPWEWARR